MSDQTGILPKWLSHQASILPKEQLRHSYTFWAMPILIFSPVQMIMTHPLGWFFVRLNELDIKLTRCQFSPSKVWKFLIKIQLTKSGPKRTVPIRIKSSSDLPKLLNQFSQKMKKTFTKLYFWRKINSHTFSPFLQSLGVFGLCQIVSFIDYLRANMSKENFNVLFKTLSMGVAGIIGIGLAAMTLSGKFKILWEGHKIWKNIPPVFDKTAVFTQ